MDREDIFRLKTAYKRVLALMSDGNWHDGHEITHPNIGGSEGKRRLREMKAKGYQYEKRRKESSQGTFQYRLLRPGAIRGNQ